MRKITLFLDELKPVSPEYKEQMTAFILQRAADQLAASILNRAAERMTRIRKKSKLPKGWKVFTNRDVVIETEPDVNQWIEHFKEK